MGGGAATEATEVQCNPVDLLWISRFALKGSFEGDIDMGLQIKVYILGYIVRALWAVWALTCLKGI